MQRTPPPTSPSMLAPADNQKITRSKQKILDSTAAKVSVGVNKKSEMAEVTITPTTTKGVVYNGTSNNLFSVEHFEILKTIINETNVNIKMLIEENKIIRTELKELKESRDNKSRKTDDKVHVSYADKVKSSGPIVLITPVNANQKCEETKKDIKDKVNPEGNQVTGIRRAAKGAIAIECKDDKSSEKLKNDAAKNLGNEYKVLVPKRRRPKIKICGLSEKLSDDEILDCLIKQNEILKSDDEIKIVKTIERKKTHFDATYDSIIETTPTGFKKIIEAEKLFVKWDSCRVFEHIHVRRCHKCLGFNHTQRECTNKISCSFCAGEHISVDCNSEKPKCVNCLWHVNKLKMKLDVNHGAYDKECPVLQRKYLQEKRKIDAIQ